MLPTLEEISYSEQKSANAFGEAFSFLMRRWQAGMRDEETAVRLLFFCWLSAIEPPYLTELPDVSPLFAEIFEQAGGENHATTLILFAVGVMAEMFPWAIGAEAAWAERAQRLKHKAKELQPNIDEASFNNFGEAGRYFRHIMRPRNGSA